MRFAATVPALFLLAAPALAQVVINEVRIDQPSTDVDEYFELAGAPGQSLDGITYVILGDSSSLPGESGVIEAAVDLTGNAIGASGLFLAGESNPLPTSGAVPDFVGNLNLENSDNVTHLLVTGFTGAVLDNLDTDNDGVLDITPWTAVIDTIAFVEEANPPVNTEFHYGPPTVGPDGSFVPAHIYRTPNGTGSLRSYEIGTFDPSDAASVDTPGAPNPNATISIATGGTQTLFLDAGASNGSNFYIVLLSAAGTSPGIPVNGVVLPLNNDALLLFSLQNANGANLVNTFGQLSAGGSASASLVIPTLGNTASANSAALVIDLNLLATFASNPVALDLVP